jgi:hypothetical protein
MLRKHMNDTPATRLWFPSGKCPEDSEFVNNPWLVSFGLFGKPSKMQAMRSLRETGRTATIHGSNADMLC